MEKKEGKEKVEVYSKSSQEQLKEALTSRAYKKFATEFFIDLKNVVISFLIFTGLSLVWVVKFIIQAIKFSVSGYRDILGKKKKKEQENENKAKKLWAY